jgi:8-oxo-dGTP pyrophosphatase MutT (NUDIX family)
MKTQDKRPVGLAESNVLEPCVKVLVCNDAGEYLVLYRSETHPRYPHDADLPGGVVGDEGHGGEDFITAAHREVEEETGLEVDATDYRMVDIWWHEVRSGKWRQRGLAVCNVAGRPKITISWEHENHEWVSFDKLVELLGKNKHGALTRDLGKIDRLVELVK